MLLRRNGEYHHGDVLGNKGVITDGSGNVLSSNEGEGVGLEYDAFGVSTFTSGSAQTPYRPIGTLLIEEGMLLMPDSDGSVYWPNRALPLCSPHRRHHHRLRHPTKPHPHQPAPDP